MNLVALDSLLWSATPAFSVQGSALVPAIQRLRNAADWDAEECVEDWWFINDQVVNLGRCSPAARLVVPWLVELARGREPGPQQWCWMIIGEIILADLTGPMELEVEAELEEAGYIARAAAPYVTTRVDSELSAVISLLSRVPTWARIFALRLVLIGQRYGTCLRCGEDLDVSWECGWTLGGQAILAAPLTEERRPVLALIRERGEAHRSAALAAVDALAGTIQCPHCSARVDAIDVLGRTLE